MGEFAFYIFTWVSLFLEDSRMIDSLWNQLAWSDTKSDGKVDFQLLKKKLSLTMTF